MDFLSQVKRMLDADEVTAIGKGVYGEAYLVKKGQQRFVLKTMPLGGFGHDHFSDIAQIFLWQNDSFNRMDKHVRSSEVLAADEAKGELLRLGDMKKFFILMDYVEGQNMFQEFDNLLKKGASALDEKHALLLSDFLVQLHSSKHAKTHLYARKLRDTIGHGECMMGLLDAYPDVDFMDENDIQAMLARSINSWLSNRKKNVRLSTVHGDFHPGNIVFNPAGSDFKLLDRSRGEFGEPADDLVAFSCNYFFFSLLKYGKFDGEFKRLNALFWGNYIIKTKDKAVLELAPLFFAFRCLVLANPIFYPDAWIAERTKQNPSVIRKKIIKFALALLRKGRYSF